MKKLKILLLIVLLVIPVSTVLAQDFLADDTIFLDRTIKTKESQFTLNNEIILVPIFSRAIEDLEISPVEWFKGIYYYTIQRLGFSDIPFHFVVTKNGETFAGNSSGLETQIPFGSYSSSAILVGYLTDSAATTFSASAIESLSTLLIDICNKTEISPGNISFSGVQITRNKSNKSVELSPKEIFGTWGTTLETIKNKVSAQYNPTPKTYTVDILDVNFPKEELSAGGESSGTLRIKNSGSYGIYGGTDTSLYLSTSNGAASRFYLNTVWASQSQIELIPETTTILPGEEATVNVSIKIPLIPGNYTESFNLKTLSGKNVQTNGADISVAIKSTDKRIVEILNTYGEAFYVRSSPSSNAEIITTVSAGERFFLLEENLETLWTRIDLLDGRSGWIARWHLGFI